MSTNDKTLVKELAMTNIPEHQENAHKPSVGTHKKRLNAVRIGLRSSEPSEIWESMQKIEDWLRENPEDRDIYKLLINVAQTKSLLQEQVYALVQTMSRNGSRTATGALSYLPSSSTGFDSKQLDALRVQLRSDKLIDILSAMEQVNKWLRDAPESQDIYALLLDAIQENSALQESVRDLLENMITVGSKAADEAKHTLISLQSLLAEADSAYYATEFNEAIHLYEELLKLRPKNVQARTQLVKAVGHKIDGIHEKIDRKIPREAIQWFRKARSSIAKSDPREAITYLNAAIEEARMLNVKFPEADELLAATQRLFHAGGQLTEDLLFSDGHQMKNSRRHQHPIPKFFISYSHKDEKDKNELVKILAPLKAQGILEIWEDRQIDPGDEWYQWIQTALNTCDIALLLISKDFLASRFIQGEELPPLLQRRKQEGLRVVPIIIRDCLWQNVTILSGIQALPNDGKAILNSKGPIRDSVWTQVGTAIANIAKQIIEARKQASS